jgi:hypothetical protein
MKKPHISIDDAYDDFGFSAVSEDELKELERKLQTDLQQRSSQLDDVTKSYQQKLEQLYKLIMPLLINLQKNPDKEYIFWPNRAEKVKEFVKKIDDLIDD